MSLRRISVGTGLALGSLALVSAPAMASVHDSSPDGFAVRHTALAPAEAADVWETLLDPAEWWDGNHTFSGDAANLSLDARAGGCFCELLPDPASKTAPPRGGVQHMQVAYLEKPRVLRITGALGPLQSEAVVGTMTFMIKPEEAGTRINVEYVVGGYFRIATDKMAPLVDRVVGAQMASLARKLGGSAAAPVSAAPADGAPNSLPAEGAPPDKPTKANKKPPIIGR